MTSLATYTSKYPSIEERIQSDSELSPRLKLPPEAWTRYTLSGDKIPFNIEWSGVSEQSLLRFKDRSDRTFIVENEAEVKEISRYLRRQGLSRRGIFSHMVFPCQDCKYITFREQRIKLLFPGSEQYDTSRHEIRTSLWTREGYLRQCGLCQYDSTHGKLHGKSLRDLMSGNGCLSEGSIPTEGEYKR